MYNGSFYNPYMLGSYQAASNIGKTGLGMKGILKGFNFSNFLTSTGKTLNVINQAIPIFYQVKPIFSNAKTMLRVMGAMKDTPSRNTISVNNNVNTNTSTNNTPNIQSNNQNQLITSSNINSSSNNPTFFL